MDTMRRRNQQCVNPQAQIVASKVAPKPGRTANPI
eukprot:CAMPEP_0174360640 /NCGR_PEP_ID=MMETSP0811_2-20130205/55220_1 /TAXON_ID=73025 ORGANISM="Eutreptiella gymnastica-like, Strain CCMP1594" /NCGR_SAMPLE_ID=MMETSP0811_2 /ASSEMBLY_ACC=CAM_ASM_000667 /LENGTH=34 /DNA_ID= /DNA_START= /DNA_END= /DNA_ORIENTATION=